MAFNENSKMKEIIADENAKALLEKYVPGASNHPQLPMIKNFTLKVVAEFPQAGISPEDYKALVEDLKNLG